MMSKSKFEISVEEGNHKKLHSYIGQWQGTCKTWFEKDVLAGEENIIATITSMLGGRFLKICYHSSLMDKPFEGEMIIGYDLPNNKCQCAWVDSFHMGTGIMLSEGAATADGFYLKGHYGNPDMPAPWGWNTAIKLQGEELIITAFNVAPGGDPEKATESVLRRTE